MSDLRTECECGVGYSNKYGTIIYPNAQCPAKSHSGRTTEPPPIRLRSADEMRQTQARVVRSYEARFIHKGRKP